MKRRIIAALAALGLSAAALAGVAPAAQANGLGGAAYVALGDSMAAGNGNLPYLVEECQRSARSYPMLVGAAMGIEPVSAACSGATTDDVAEQLARLVASGEIGWATQVVTLTAGANDLEWQDVLMACATPGMEAACEAAKQQMMLAGQAVLLKLTELLAAIHGVAPAAAIVVTGYPTLFGEVATSCSIGNFEGTPVKVPASLTEEVNTALDGLNYVIAVATWAFATASGADAMFVDVDAAFQTHRLCDTGDRWISGLVRGVPVDRGLHPNAAGQQAFANSILAAMT